jgi:hypothetical protein
LWIASPRRASNRSCSASENRSSSREQMLGARGKSGRRRMHPIVQDLLEVIVGRSGTGK